MKPSSPISLTSSSLVRKTRLSPYLFILLAFILFVSVLYGEDFMCIFGQLEPSFVLPSFQTLEKNTKPKNLAFAIGKTEENCDVFSGKWVRDDISRPPYEEWECPYIQPQLTCQEHGRPDKDYQIWRWQPNNCNLPTDIKREVDDVCRRFIKPRNVCINDLSSYRQILDDQKSINTTGSLTVFTAKEYNATIEFYWAPFLLESNSDDAVVHRISDRVVRKGSLEKH